MVELIKVARQLRINHLVNPILSRAPHGIRTWAFNERLKLKVKQGFRLVPETTLENTYREGLYYLLQGRDASTLGDYLEFGVCHGASLACMHRVLVELELDQVRLFGFDSFEGLPEAAATDCDQVWEPGQYRSELSFTRDFLDRAGVRWDRVHLVKGWFSDTLTDELRRRHVIQKASVIMIDCDLYVSACEALAFCAPLIHDQAIICFDDWHPDGLAEKNMGEKRAFDEFLGTHPELTASQLPSYCANAEVFLVTRTEPLVSIPSRSTE